MTAKITEAQRDVLESLDWANHNSTFPLAWCRPMDLGAFNGSHHSGALNALARKGLVQFKQRHSPDPPDGQNGRKIWRGRGSKCYRITPAGRAALAEAEGKGGGNG